MVKLAFVTKFGRESGSMIRTTATFGAALMAAAMANYDLSIAYSMKFPRQLTVNVLRLVFGQVSGLELSVGGLGSTITSREIVDDDAHDIGARCLCHHGSYQWNTSDCIATQNYCQYCVPFPLQLNLHPQESAHFGNLSTLRLDACIGHIGHGS